jgi:hypothetical protein
LPLTGTESALADALHAAATATSGDAKAAWKKVAEIIISHITGNSLVTGTTPNGPLTNGKVT